MRDQGIELAVALGNPDIWDALLAGTEFKRGRFVPPPILQPNAVARRGSQERLRTLLAGIPADHPARRAIVDQVQLMHLAGAEDLRDIGCFIQLRELAVYGAARLQDLSALAPLIALELLKIYSAPRLVSLTGLEGLSRQRELELGNVPRLQDHAPLGCCSSLERLRLVGAVGLSLEPLMAIGGLTRVELLGCTGLRPVVYTPAGRSQPLWDLR